MEPIDLGDLNKKMDEALEFIGKWSEHIKYLLQAYTIERGQTYGTLAYLMKKYNVESFEVTWEDFTEVYRNGEWIQFLPTDKEDTLLVKLVKTGTPPTYKNTEIKE